tara:strand:- start:68 stop:475 length:408 start_codon:yes stop_codon:yes gene_type:complete
MLSEIINFYKSFDDYCKFTDSELYYHLYPSFEFNQYKIYTQDKQIIGFVNWCFLSDDIQEIFKKRGFINPDQWNTGRNLWIVDLLSARDTLRIASDIKRMALLMVGNRKNMNYLRVKNNEIKSRQTFLTKNHWGK